MTDTKSDKVTDALPAPTTTPAAGDGKSQTPEISTGVSNIVRRWKREDLVKRGSLVLHGFGLVFSLIAFIVMASNTHGDWKDFDRYEEYRYVLAVAILCTLYTGLQFLRQIHELSTGKESFSQQKLALLSFISDQVVAYLLLSAASSAVPLTNRMRENNDNIFTDSSVAAISMEFFAFFALAVSALISGYKLSNKSYI
ncbi:PREDICTED: CASP-like protein 4B1 [Nicotiana attenuata]|uniref:CASP-like protein n=1 Tax=Nicotiana attenuata TaxID=49451 RepID=A0A1J6HZ87_NICAT|nr:PREDICTED: CASP-like protein 4B1 [Nicotiana attenuata]OIS98125.1 casp-like protein 4b1 [Nicotiana attenuata]